VVRVDAIGYLPAPALVGCEDTFGGMSYLVSDMDAIG
jgi:hypothetical protein